MLLLISANSKTQHSAVIIADVFGKLGFSYLRMIPIEAATKL
ncbi:hypothetical protein [Candidatus Pseudomonas adelgestsugas]|uniref:Uncharacterized protein n=1 Tax=Candidatus Pseudomonas adelgestsugas TaxID=1302376 RepID=A0ABX5R825_9PSED|nr:hypothetical protein C3B55_00464 [Candidatus Pseudomonas adelgestsugas]